MNRDGHLYFPCPHCGAELSIPQDHPITTGPCPACGEVISAPIAQKKPLTPSPKNRESYQSHVFRKKRPANTPRPAPSSQKSSHPAWILPILCLLALALTGSIWWIRSSPTPSSSTTSPSGEKKTSPALFSRKPLEVARAFAQTANPAERLKLVRNPGEVSQHLHLYPEQALRETNMSIKPLNTVHGREFPYAQLTARFPNGDHRLICVVKTPEGEKIDWDAFARYGTASWQDLLSGKADHATVRVFARPATYYNYHFSDDKKWACYRLSSPDLTEDLWGYASRKSRTQQILTRATTGKKRRLPRRVTLHITTTPENTAKNMVTITEVKALNWVIGEKNFEEHWQPGTSKTK